MLAPHASHRMAHIRRSGPRYGHPLGLRREQLLDNRGESRGWSRRDVPPDVGFYPAHFGAESRSGYLDDATITLQR